jgi:hypothetical protein
MTLLKLAWAFLRRVPWQAWAGLAVVAVFMWHGHSRYQAGLKQGRAEITAQWQADTAKRDKADADAVEADRKRKQDAQDHNDQVEKQHADDLAAISADRDGLVRLLRQADDQVRALTAGKATDQLGIAVARQIASRAEETYRLLGNYDAACRADASQLDALIAEIKPQL